MFFPARGLLHKLLSLSGMLTSHPSPCLFILQGFPPENPPWSPQTGLGWVPFLSTPWLFPSQGSAHFWFLVKARDQIWAVSSATAGSVVSRESMSGSAHQSSDDSMGTPPHRAGALAHATLRLRAGAPHSPCCSGGFGAPV